MNEELEEVANAIRGREFLDFFLPEPKDLKDDEVFYWREKNWGTDRTILNSKSFEKYFRENTGSIFFQFESAWNPPLKLYEELTRRGWHVDASYVEFGNSLRGLWNSNCDMRKKD